MADMQSTAALASAKTVGRPGNYYPSPFFDLALTYMPANVKDTFDWCAYYFRTNPIINGVVTKLASYPITDLLYDEKTSSESYRSMFEGHLSLRTFLVEFGLDRHCFGIAFATVVFPFRKILTCRKCDTSIEAARASYTFRGGKFSLECKKCGHEDAAKVRDETLPAAKQVRLKRWNPQQISIRVNEATGEPRYFYSLSRAARNEILLGNRKTLESTPQAFIEAVHDNKLIELDKSKLFVSRRPSISRGMSDEGWGEPIILPVLKDVFLLQVLKKSQEVVAMEYILPFRAMYPEVRADGNNIYGQMNLSAWQDSVKKEIQQWKKDPAHIAVFPVPIGQQVMGGQGRSLLLHQEVRVYSDQIIAGMGVPTGFFYGEALYSGASVNLRALENEFLAYRQDMQHLVEFIVTLLSQGLGIEPTIVRFREFKMADDLARASMDMNLANSNRISWRTYLTARGFDYDHENSLILEEIDDLAERNKRNATAQSAAQAVMSKEQVRSQSVVQALMARAQGAQPPGAMPQQGGMPPQGGAPQGPTGAPQGPQQAPQQDSSAQANGLAQQLMQLPETARYQQLMRMRQEAPDLYVAVNNLMQGAQESSGQQPMKALPEQKPPRATGTRKQL